MSRDPDFRGRGAGGDGGPPEEDGDSFAEVLNRFTFDSGRSRRKRSRRDPDPPEPPEPPRSQDPQAEPFRGQPVSRGWPEDAPPGYEWPEPSRRQSPPSEDYFEPPQQQRYEPPQQQRYEPPPQQRQSQPWQPPPPQWEPEPADDAAPAAASIRPYAWTGGRTKSSYQFEMETLVSTSEWYRPNAMLRGEHQSIVEMCRHPRSVAEVAALLSVPLGVARVLLADMAELGLITVHQTVTEGGSTPHLNLMERVLSGLRRL